MSYEPPMIPFTPQAAPTALVTGHKVRFSILTDRMLRLEYSPENTFEDRPSQVFWFRSQPVPSFKLLQDAKTIEIDTGALHLVYQISPPGFTRETLSITVRSTGVTWHYGDHDHQNLHGTGRTLDGADGPIHLEPGLLSRSGWAVVDDSDTLVFDPTGWLEPRRQDGKSPNRDLYFLGYGHAYTECLLDYFKVAGSVPLVPRWILGNWWSRFWEYSQAELAGLMQEFKDRQMPLSVCIIDMDWHITRTGNGSSGWTGYTWNRDLFPDPSGFLKWLHADMGLRTAMNLHPADGIWPHEEMYPQLASLMGIDPASGRPVEFDIADPEFTRHYFEILHHPYEEMGVDFWWMDWQQGQHIAHSRRKLAETLDPLWWLNHLHFYDLGRGGKKRSFVFSRWGGLGNHRYPIGFSGDSVVSWKTLAFQPFFTSTAANVAFGWWSHDIGGHMVGIEDGELYARWVQYGVFSPILRLHCTKNPYQDRAPWAFGEDIFKVARSALQLRHALIPYLYTMAWKFTRSGIPLAAPMYYAYPEREEAYQSPNQYLFGDQLLAAPYISPKDPDTNLSRTAVWLPEEDWYDFFSGEYYRGNRWVTVYGGLEEIPVFARAGAIVPLASPPTWAGVDVPTHLSIQVFPGRSGEFNLYEDDGVSGAYLNGASSLVRFSVEWNETHQVFHIEPAQGSLGHLPSQRSYELVFLGIRQPDRIEAKINGTAVKPVWQWRASTGLLVVSGLTLAPTDSLDIDLSIDGGSLLDKTDRRADKVRQRLHAFRLESVVKSTIDHFLPQLLADSSLLGMGANYLKDSQVAALANALEK